MNFKNIILIATVSLFSNFSILGSERNLGTEEAQWKYLEDKLIKVPPSTIQKYFKIGYLSYNALDAMGLAFLVLYGIGILNKINLYWS